MNSKNNMDNCRLRKCPNGLCDYLIGALNDNEYKEVINDMIERFIQRIDKVLRDRYIEYMIIFMKEMPLKGKDNNERLKDDEEGDNKEMNEEERIEKELQMKETKLNNYNALYYYHLYDYFLNKIAQIIEVNHKKCLIKFYYKTVLYGHNTIVKENKRFIVMNKYHVLRNLLVTSMFFIPYRQLILLSWFKIWYCNYKLASFQKVNKQSMLIHTINKKGEKEFYKKPINKSSNVHLITFLRELRIIPFVDQLCELLKKNNHLKNIKCWFLGMLLTNIPKKNDEDNDDLYCLLCLFIFTLENHYSLSTRLKLKLKEYKQSSINDFAYINLSIKKNNQVKALCNTISTIHIPSSSHLINIILFKKFTQWIHISSYPYLYLSPDFFNTIHSKIFKAKTIYLSSIIKRKVRNLFNLFNYKANKHIQYDKSFILNIENKYNNKLLQVLNGLTKSSYIMHRKYYPVRLSSMTKWNQSLSRSLFIDQFHKWRVKSQSIGKETTITLVYHILIRAINNAVIIWYNNNALRLLNEIKHHSSLSCLIYKRLYMFNEIIDSVIKTYHSLNKSSLINRLSIKARINQQVKMIRTKERGRAMFNSLHAIIVTFCLKYAFNQLTSNKMVIKQLNYRTAELVINCSKLVKILNYVIIKKPLSIFFCEYKHSQLYKLQNNDKERYNNQIDNNIITNSSYILLIMNQQTIAQQKKAKMIKILKFLIYRSLHIQSHKINSIPKAFHKWYNQAHISKVSIKETINNYSKQKVEIKLKIMDYIESNEYIRNEINQIYQSSENCISCIKLTKIAHLKNKEESVFNGVTQEGGELSERQIMNFTKTYNDDELHAINNEMNLNPMNTPKKNNIYSTEKALGDFNNDEQDETPQKIDNDTEDRITSLYINKCNSRNSIKTKKDLVKEYMVEQLGSCSYKGIDEFNNTMHNNKSITNTNDDNINNNEQINDDLLNQLDEYEKKLLLKVNVRTIQYEEQISKMQHEIDVLYEEIDDFVNNN